MPKIFISYRREDAGGHARHLFSELAELYGEKNVFMDVVTLAGGEAWADRIDEEVARCDVFLALIGKRWLEARDEEGNRRLDEPGDYVRREVASGLARDTLVIPVLLDGVKMPSEEELPDEIDALSRRNAVELTSSRWDYDFERLCELLPASPRRRLRFAALALAVAAALAALYFGALKTPPQRMEGVFNVAVLDFGQRIAGDDRDQPSEEGRWLANQVFESLGGLQAKLASDQELPSGLVEIGRFEERPEGATPLEAEASLSETAARLNATLIVYGTLDFSEPPYSFAPSLYLTQDFDGGEELTGETTFGRPIRISPPLDESADGLRNRLELVEKLSGRLEGMHLVTLGLAYLQTRQPERAIELFYRADAVRGWTDGKELVQLYRGVSLLMLDEPQAALGAFGAVLSAGPLHRDRALMGVGNSFSARGSLDRAADYFRQALAAEPSAPLARVGIKASFNLGLMLSLNAQGLDTSCDAQEARDALTRVVDEYLATPESEVLRELAYKAEYQLGLLSQHCGDLLAAEPERALAAFLDSLPHLASATELAEPRALEGTPGLVEDRRWQRDRWLAWRVLGYTQLRLAELGESERSAKAVESLAKVTTRYERGDGEVPDAVAANAYRLLSRALEPSDPAAAAEARNALASISGG